MDLITGAAGLIGGHLAAPAAAHPRSARDGDGAQPDIE
jgi:uncharacterized protein YbjT (DUF2867 family)